LLDFSVDALGFRSIARCEPSERVALGAPIALSRAIASAFIVAHGLIESRDRMHGGD
jgi:hypothetical protein